MAGDGPGSACIRRSPRWGSARLELMRCGTSNTTVIRLLDGTRAYLHAVIDNFSRRILAWRVADTFAPVNRVAVLLEASQGATPSGCPPVVLADAGVENVNAQVDELIGTGVLRRLLAFTELEVLELHDRSLVAFPETSMALPPLTR
jgi:transposase InsO family protein